MDVTASVNVDKNKFLSVKRSRSKYLIGHWEFPSGKTDPGETQSNASSVS